ncbi:MAG TPA: hypothetical protein ENN11_00100 [Methanomicrobia archaeon]|nr:hypothetical protein [Methanomicrobia archaeon]
MISDLGGTIPPDSIVLGPASTIFNVTMVVCGLMLIAGAYLLHKLYRRPLFTVFFMLFGIGALEWACSRATRETRTRLQR